MITTFKKPLNVDEKVDVEDNVKVDRNATNDLDTTDIDVLDEEEKAEREKYLAEWIDDPYDNNTPISNEFDWDPGENPNDRDDIRFANVNEFLDYLGYEPIVIPTDDDNESYSEDSYTDPSPNGYQVEAYPIRPKPIQPTDDNPQQTYNQNLAILRDYDTNHLEYDAKSKQALKRATDALRK